MKKLLCITLCVVLILSLALPSFASELPSPDSIVIYEQDNVRIEGYEDSENNTVLCEYVDDVLVRRNTIFPNRSRPIQCEIFNPGETTPTRVEELRYQDYGVLEERILPSPYSLCVSGTINYRTPDEFSSTGYMNYSMRCKCYDSPAVQTTYTINGFLGHFADLLAIITGALLIPSGICSSYLDALLSAMKIVRVKNVIKSAVTVTVACLRTDYNWDLVDTRDSSRTAAMYGSKYYINDVGSKYYADTYYEGFTPSDWKTQYLATSFQYALFGYSIFDVVSWG